MRHTIQHTFTMCMHDNNNASNKSQQKTNHTVSLCYARSFTWIQTHSIYSNCARTHSTHIRDQSLPLSQAQARTPQYKRAHFVGDTLFSRTVGAAAARCYHRRYICCFFLIVHMLMNSFYSLHLYRYSLHFRTFFFYTHTHSFAHWPNMREKKHTKIIKKRIQKINKIHRHDEEPYHHHRAYGQRIDQSSHCCVLLCTYKMPCWLTDWLAMAFLIQQILTRTNRNNSTQSESERKKERKTVRRKWNESQAMPSKERLNFELNWVSTESN